MFSVGRCSVLICSIRIVVVPGRPGCNLTSNTNLPKSIHRRADLYEGDWTRDQMLPANGIYESGAACRAGEVDALTWNCPSTFIERPTVGASEEGDSLVEELEKALGELN